MGGLTVMRALKERLPSESFIYLGDTARLPYGTKSADTVTRYAVQARKALPQEPLTHLLRAQAAQLAGDLRRHHREPWQQHQPSEEGGARQIGRAHV